MILVYRPGKEKKGPDTFTRIYCQAISDSTLQQVHDSLYHPGITRMIHFVRSRNLPYSVDDIRKTISKCQVRAELKPQFYQSHGTLLI